MDFNPRQLYLKLADDKTERRELDGRIEVGENFIR